VNIIPQTEIKGEIAPGSKAYTDKSFPFSLISYNQRVNPVKQLLQQTA
jgi:hypothetical protein